MILLTKGQGNKKLTFTLNEKKTLTEPYYLFVFEKVGGGTTVKFIKSSASDESDYPLRCNEWTVNVNTLFNSADPGGYNYTVYEQASSTNEDTSLTTGVVEWGKMTLKKATQFAPEGYDSTHTVKAYNG
jgi:hypothetical protein